VGTFVTNPAELIPGPKNANRAVPEGGNAADYLVAGDYNAIRNALHDLRDAIIAGLGGTTGLTVYSAATRPAAAEGYANKLVIVDEPGADVELQFCRRTASGSYEWIVVAY
jgi:hypothetical protein